MPAKQTIAGNTKANKVPSQAAPTRPSPTTIPVKGRARPLERQVRVTGGNTGSRPPPNR